MVAGGGDNLRQAAEDRARRIDSHLGLLAVHQPRRIGHHAAECFTDRLMPQTHAQNRQFIRQRAHGIFTNARLRRLPRSRRQNQVRRRKLPDPIHRDFIIAHHLNIGADTARQLKEIIGKAVVVINKQNHKSLSFRASSKARTTACALLMHS